MNPSLDELLSQSIRAARRRVRGLERSPLPRDFIQRLEETTRLENPVDVADTTLTLLIALGMFKASEILGYSRGGQVSQLQLLVRDAHPDRIHIGSARRRQAGWIELPHAVRPWMARWLSFAHVIRDDQGTGVLHLKHRPETLPESCVYASVPPDVTVFARIANLRGKAGASPSHSGPIRMESLVR